MAFGSPQWMYASGEDFTIDQSLRFNDDDSAYLSRTPASAGNRKTWTWSAWLKVGNTGTNRTFFSTTGSQYTTLRIDSNDELVFFIDDTTSKYVYTNAKFRDPSAWYHIVVAFDTTQGTAANRVKLYVNGEQITSLQYALYPAEDYEGTINNNIAHSIGRGEQGADNYHDGYLAEVHFIDGTALTPTSFGETGDYGEWKPKQVSGLTYGTNGFYLDFADSGNLGDDESGNTNDWTSNNLAATDQMVDSPTNNFATFNPLDTTTSGRTISEGNLKVSCTSTGCNISSIGMSSGKWYAEFYFVSGTYERVGITNEAGTVAGLGETANGWAKINNSARLYHNGSAPSYGTNWDATEICMVAFDADAGKIWYGVDGTWDASGNPATASNPSQSSVTGNDFFFATSSGSGTLVYVANYGQDSSFAGNKTAQGNQDGNSIGDFYYTPPTGFLALCTSNLPAVAVTPSEHFNTVLYTGNNTTSRTITGAGFAPDLLWGKTRGSINNNFLFDTLRGTGRIITNSTAAEADYATWFSTLTSDGFTTGTTMANSMNKDDDPFVAWFWKANGSGSSNTDGSITSTVSANADAGFSIATFTGAASAVFTVGHGLSKAPELVIQKDRDVSSAWWSFAEPLGGTKALRLDTTGAEVTATSLWNDTAPSSSIVTFGNGYSANDMVMYCFHSVDGYSKVGSYTGNGAADDNTFIYTGFRVKYVLIKSSSAVEPWMIMDAVRHPHNENDSQIRADSSNAENNDGNGIDLLSNGFKIKSAIGNWGSDGATYIYMAFAETPFKYANAR
jgi:hypothetical protein